MSTQASYSCLMRGYSILKYALQPKNCSDLGMSYLYKNLQVSLQGSSWVFSNWVWHKVGRTHLALQNAWVYSKWGRSKCFSNYLNFRTKNISKYKLLHSRVDPMQKVYRSRFDVGRFMPGSWFMLEESCPFWLVRLSNKIYGNIPEVGSKVPKPQNKVKPQVHMITIARSL